MARHRLEIGAESFSDYVLAKWKPKTAEDWSHVVCAYNELINYADSHEDADDDDRPKMRQAMLYIAEKLDKLADKACASARISC